MKKQIMYKSDKKCIELVIRNTLLERILVQHFFF